MSIDKISYRLATRHDQALIDEMNVIASLGAVVPDNEMPTAAEFFDYAPHAQAYSRYFGQPGDLGVIAHDDIRGDDAGAIWGREYQRTEKDGVLQDHPFEIAIAVRESLRGQGVGLQLLDSMAALAWMAGKPELSLGVHEKSPARRLYETAGFVVLKNLDGSEARVNEKFIPMLKKL